MALSKSYYLDKMRRLNTHISNADFDLDLDFSELGDRLDKAQKALDSAILSDMVRYMPERSGRLINATIAANQGRVGELIVYPPDLPYGHYQWEGEKYVNPDRGPIYKGAKLVPSGESLHYTNHKAEAHWDEAVIRDNMNKYIDLVQSIVSGS